jgi:hypothetical protein
MGAGVSAASSTEGEKGGDNASPTKSSSTSTREFSIYKKEYKKFKAVKSNEELFNELNLKVKAQPHNHRGRGSCPDITISRQVSTPFDFHRLNLHETHHEAENDRKGRMTNAPIERASSDLELHSFSEKRRRAHIFHDPNAEKEEKVITINFMKMVSLVTHTLALWTFYSSLNATNFCANPSFSHHTLIKQLQ